MSKFKKCKNCIMHTGMPNILIDINGLCSECNGYYHNLKNSPFLFDKEKSRERMEKNLKTYKDKKFLYNALVLVSGGKDSAYLLHLLKNKYKLNVLALFIDSPAVNGLSRNNVLEISKKFNIDFFQFRVDEKIFKKFISLGLKKCKINNIGPRFGCGFCLYLRSAISLNIATKLNIPVIMSGVDSDQFPNPLLLDEQGEIKNFYIKNNFYMKEIFQEVFQNEFNDSIYDLNIEKNTLPHIIYPLTFLNHDQEKIFEYLQKIGLNKNNFKSSSTSCDLIYFFDFFSFKWFDASSQSLIISNKIRKDGYYFVNNKKLKKEDAEIILKEYKDALFLIAGDEKIIKKDNYFFKKFLPNTSKILNGDDFNILINNIKKIKIHSDYFNIKIL